MQNLNFKSLKKHNNYKSTVLFNSVLWSLTFVILLFIFSKGQIPITADYIYTISFLVMVAIPVNINFYGLIPKFLKQERYALYFLMFLLNFLVFAVLASRFFNLILDTFFSKYFFISYLSKVGFFSTLVIILITSTLFKLAEDWFYFNTHQNKLLKQKNHLIKNQLLALRAQINPHFLFNSLNVIYAMALEKKQTITTAIVELSDILRYVIYDSNTERVTLKDELKLLKNYISFQKYRGQSEHLVDLKIEIENANYKIYPMLLLPLIENAYKYSFSGEESSEKISVELIQKKSKFKFKIQNSKTNLISNLDDNYSGIGLKNLENNLNLVYPNNHKFKVLNYDKTFIVTIEITDEQ